MLKENPPSCRWCNRVSTAEHAEERLQWRAFLRCLVTSQNGLNCLADTLILISMLSGSALAFAGQRTELAAQA